MKKLTKLKLCRVLFFGSLFVTSSINAQCVDYSTGWTSVGSTVTASSSTCTFTSTPGGGTTNDQRIYKQLNSAGTPLSDVCWAFRFEFTPTAYTDPAHLIAAVTAGTANPVYSSYPTKSNQDFVGVRYDKPNSGDTAKLKIEIKEDNNTSNLSTGILAATLNTTYYVQLDRNSNIITLTVYSDSGYSTVIGTKTKNLTTLGYTITGLTHLQHANLLAAGSSRLLSATVTNLCFVSNGCNTNTCENYSSSSGWTTVGTSGGTTVSVTGGQCVFNSTNDGATSNDQRAYKSWYGGTALSDECWTTKFEFNATNDSTPSHLIVAFTAGTANPRYAVNDYPNWTNQDYIGIRYEENSSSPTYMYIEVKDNNNASSLSSSGIDVSTINTTYYVKLERNADIITLTVYSDSGYSTSIASVTKDISALAITGLTHLQHANNIEGGATRVLSATIDNLCIDDNCSGMRSLVSNSESVNEYELGLKVYPNPSEGIFELVIENQNGESEIIVYDNIGRQIFNKSIKDKNQETVDISHKSSGVYFVRLINGNNSLVKKIIIK